MISKFIIDYFSNTLPEAAIELNYNNPFELVVAVILSAQCTDKRVNSVTPSLFARFPNANTLASAEFEDVFLYVKSISYPNNKTKYLISMSKVLVENFNSVIPNNFSDLRTLPGIGRKGANVIASVLYNMPYMPVDTHVFRVSKRLGIVSPSAKTPLAVEKELIKNIPNEYINKAHHWLVLHGRYICLARKPKCSECGLKPECLFFKNRTKK